MKVCDVLRPISILACLSLSACAGNLSNQTTSTKLAGIFSETCLKAVLDEPPLINAFDGNPSFVLSARPANPPRLVIFDGPNETVGIVRADPASGGAQLSCSTSATIPDAEQIHAATDSVLALRFKEYQSETTRRGWVERRIKLENSRTLEVTTLRRRVSPKQKAGSIGNVTISARLKVIPDE